MLHERQSVCNLAVRLQFEYAQCQRLQDAGSGPRFEQLAIQVDRMLGQLGVLPAQASVSNTFGLIDSNLPSSPPEFSDNSSR